ncbi:MAG: citrate/2-methylcitrate synthase [Clostridia bacterium]|nr:citrate/2-methylcitrate synthase [Clostridia bacterium]
MKQTIETITPTVIKLSDVCRKSDAVNPDNYEKYDVKRGLRDAQGRGVVAGLTNISDVIAKKTVNGEEVPCRGELYYRGYNIKDLTEGFLSKGRFGFEEAAYLLLIGELPTEEELADFTRELRDRCTLPRNFFRDVIMKAPSANMMISLSRSILTLYSYDHYADDTSLENVMRQCLNMISQFPMLAVYGYQAYRHSEGDSLIIHRPDRKLSVAENILMMLRDDKQYTPIEAAVLDLALVLHMEHGGGNNSTFTTRVVTSSGTDTYSTMAAALGSLKGPRHGGANIKVVEMMNDMRKHVNDPEDDDEIKHYLTGILAKENFDRSGLIYGVGHAIYSKSDPRAEIFKEFVGKLAATKHKSKEFKLYSAVERLAPELIAEKRKMYKGVSINVDFYSGLLYRMLGLPLELFTPMFAVSRIVGWSAHRLEELCAANKIIRPAYVSTFGHRDYIDIEKR